MPFYLLNLVTHVSLLSLIRIRFVGQSGFRERGEPETAVREPSAGTVHRKPDVSIKCVPVHIAIQIKQRQQKGKEVNPSPSLLWSINDDTHTRSTPLMNGVVARDSPSFTQTT